MNITLLRGMLNLGLEFNSNQSINPTILRN